MLACRPSRCQLTAEKLTGFPHRREDRVSVAGESTIHMLVPPGLFRDIRDSVEASYAMFLVTASFRSVYL